MKEHRQCIIAPFGSLKPAMNAAEYLQVHRWSCAACASAYDLGSIESALIAVVQQQERAYQLQDLKCSKCRNVSACLQQPLQRDRISCCQQQLSSRRTILDAMVSLLVMTARRLLCCAVCPLLHEHVG